MSRIQIKSRRRTATHILKGISWENVSGSNEHQEAHGNSHAGREVMPARQRFKWRPGRAQQLTSWKGSHAHVRDSNGGAHGDSPTKVGDLFLCRQFEITNLTCLLPISYIQ